MLWRGEKMQKVSLIDLFSNAKLISINSFDKNCYWKYSDKITDWQYSGWSYSKTIKVCPDDNHNVDILVKETGEMILVFFYSKNHSFVITSPNGESDINSFINSWGGSISSKNTLPLDIGVTFDNQFVILD